MSLFAESELRQSSSEIIKAARKTATRILIEDKAAPIDKEFDIFLSHSYLDADVILGLREGINNMGFSVYVDWIDDEDLERSEVSKETAEQLRKRMKHCKCLFFATSGNSAHSKWMPWECGYFDGIRSKVAICPVTKKPTGSDSYEGQEYLGLYPYITKDKPEGKSEDTLWVNESLTKYITVSRWLKGGSPREH